MLDYLYLNTPVGSVALHLPAGPRSITDATGLSGISSLRGDVYVLPDADGVVEPSQQRVDAKVIPLVGEVWGQTIDEAWQQWDVLAGAFISIKDAPGGTLRWQRAGGGLALQQRVRLAGAFQPPISDGQNFLSYQVVLRAADPAAYTATSQSATVDPTIGSIGGISMPLVWPLDLGGGGTGGLTLTNQGNYRARPVYTLTGPWQNPSLHNQTTGDEISSIGLTLAAGEVLVIDTAQELVTYQGTDATPSFDWKNSAWPELAPGANVITVGGFPGAGSVLAATFNDAYVS